MSDQMEDELLSINIVKRGTKVRAPRRENAAAAGGPVCVRRAAAAGGPVCVRVRCYLRVRACVRPRVLGRVRAVR
jgi:hypothetical protein